MADDRNNDLVHSYMDEVWHKGNPDAVEEFLDDNYVRHVSPTSPPIGRQDQIDRLKGFRSAFPDIKITVEDVVASGDRVAFRSTMRGTHQGEFLGVAAAGTQVEVHLLDLWRISEGRVIEQWGGPDIFDLLRQLEPS
jgi:steroid delta-isomerase-like uncharacterized protein